MARTVAHRPRPQGVRDRVPPPMTVHPVENARVRTEPLHRVGGAGPLPVGRHPAHGGRTVVVAQRVAGPGSARPSHRAPRPRRRPSARVPPGSRTVTSTLPVPRRLVVTVGTPASTLPVSATTMTSATKLRLAPATSRSRPPVDISSEPSHTTVKDTGQPPSTSRSARSAVRCMTRLPLQSAAPRAYQRPSRSVRVHGSRTTRPRPPPAGRRSARRAGPVGAPAGPGGPTDDDDAAVVGVEEPDVVDAQSR